MNRQNMQTFSLFNCHSTNSFESITNATEYSELKVKFYVRREKGLQLSSDLLGSNILKRTMVSLFLARKLFF